MTHSKFTRRQFLQTSAALAGVAMVGPLVASGQAVKKTAIDQVTLGNTGIKLSRLGMGTGLDNGRILTGAGRDNFNKIIRHGYDQGITYFDTCDRYETSPWLAGAIKGMPREKLYIQSKISGQPVDLLAAIDAERKKINTDYFDSMLIHSQINPGWINLDPWKKMMDNFLVAQEKKWIRARGVSCHNLPALQDANKTDWCQVHLVRVNPQGKYVDGAGGRGYTASETNPIEPVLVEIKSMHEKGRGVIGMKIFGNGLFTDPAEREKSVKFAMSNPNIDAVVIGFKNTQEVDEGIAMINRALAA
ncbi:MAG TPA: aldo/keto reductase [Tepidisphaeraceae bacterium]|nr:aldo/keto reductase [Tepidisphaeraceae bacterium]